MKIAAVGFQVCNDRIIEFCGKIGEADFVGVHQISHGCRLAEISDRLLLDQ